MNKPPGRLAAHCSRALITDSERLEMNLFQQPLPHQTLRNIHFIRCSMSRKSQVQSMTGRGLSSGQPHHMDYRRVRDPAFPSCKWGTAGIRAAGARGFLRSLPTWVYKSGSPEIPITKPRCSRGLPRNHRIKKLTTTKQTKKQTNKKTPTKPQTRSEQVFRQVFLI